MRYEPIGQLSVRIWPAGTFRVAMAGTTVAVATASGATSLKIAALDTKELTVSGSGAMRIELAGKATEQRVSISGAGDYRAAELASEDARVSVSYTGLPGDVAPGMRIFLNDGLLSLVVDRNRNRIYGASSPTGDLYAYDIAKGRTTLLGRPDYARPYVYVGRALWSSSL